MSTTQQSRHTDVLIIGAGIVGLAHAVEAARAGLSVRIIERDHFAVGASIRNFGHCCVTGQHGEFLRIAERSREGWLAAAADVGFWAPEAGAFALARTEAEHAVLEQFAEQRGPDSAEMLTPEQVRERFGSAVDLDQKLRAGAFLPQDLRVDPRVTVASIAAWLERLPNLDLLWNTTVSSVGDGAVSTPRGDFTADRVVVCVGHDLGRLFPELAEEHEIKSCALQMALAGGPRGYAVNAAVITGTSLARYDGFVNTPGNAALVEELRRDSPELVDMVANVMFTRRPDGTLILGDSHVYGNTLDPFLDEWITERLVAEISQVLGRPLTVTQRWQGIYATSSKTPLLISDRGKTTVVCVATGVGMTLAFGLAKDTWERV